MRRIVATLAAASCFLLSGRAVHASTNFEQVVREFSAARYALARHLSARLDRPLPRVAHEFFRAAETDTWESVSNRFEKVKLSSQYGPAVPELRNELWAPIHETMGIWEVWVGWNRSSSLLEMFYKPVLESMPQNSIYFGGTDYGRFVITTVNALSKPPSVFCITQNALADNTYVSHLRAVNGDRLVLPQPKDSARAFQQYIEEVRRGKRPDNAQITIENGRVSVTGVLGVMELNGMLCKMIFDNNSNDFFVEESYVIDWMYPYLEPHGLIMKLNAYPLDSLPDDAVERDRRYWADYESRLLAHADYADNLGAQKAFSKLRSAIGGLYVFRERYDEAEQAFRQAIRLCPVSPEASFRLSKMYEQNGRFAEAIEVMEQYIAADPPFPLEDAQTYLGKLRSAERLGPTEPRPAKSP